MLNNRAISLGCLLVWVGIILGLGLLTLAQILRVRDLAGWGIAALCLACTYSVNRQMARREERLREVFNLGRNVERRERELTAVR
jgi:hypothetical protein